MTEEDAKQFIKKLRAFEFGKQDGKPLKEWEFFEADTLKAAMSAALVAGRDAVWHAGRHAVFNAVRDAVWHAGRDAVFNAVRDAAFDAVRDAVWHAGRDAVGDAVFDAALVACWELVKDLKIKNKKQHEKYVCKVWQVYEKGYFCLCDVKGKLYVYGKKEKE